MTERSFEAVKTLFETLVETVNKEYEIRENIYKNLGSYDERMFDLFNRIQDGEINDITEIMEEVENIVEGDKEQEIE